jgi:lactam utilization protein B
MTKDELETLYKMEQKVDDLSERFSKQEGKMDGILKSQADMITHEKCHAIRKEDKKDKKSVYALVIAAVAALSSLAAIIKAMGGLG